MEICIDSIESARNAIHGGASRLEICSALSEGGLTPTPGFLKQIKNFSPIPIYAMLRIRSGDFIYSNEELDCMLHDLQLLKNHGADGFVFGALTLNNNIDKDACTKILSTAHPLPVTFHRAFDEIIDPTNALEDLINLGFERVLTSGQQNNAEEGLELIRTLVEKARKRIVIMPGSGITVDNILKIKMISRADEFHASAKKRKLLSGGNKVRIGANVECDYMVTDVELVRKMVEIVNGKGTN